MTSNNFKEDLVRLNYIGSKLNLLEWIEECILSYTKLNSLRDIKIGDLFSGTGIVSYFFRTKNAIITSNDSELYSFIITKAMSSLVYSQEIQNEIDFINMELKDKKHININGNIVKHYSPKGSRNFFTIDNSQRIDYIKERIKDSPNFDFLMASLIVSADNVSNVPAVYGCFLKNFKQKALKELVLKPIHKNDLFPKIGTIFNDDIINVIDKIDCQIVYLDPPYNERQYSKNYFPLNILAKYDDNIVLTGKTGIPTDCFISSLCKKREIKNAFENIFQKLAKNKNIKWVFMSYNSEGLLKKDEIQKIIIQNAENKKVNIEVKEKEYKRFKSFSYNKDTDINEYLFCVSYE
jgi:adenine-specific DNA-methyltransferase